MSARRRAGSTTIALLLAAVLAAAVAACGGDDVASTTTTDGDAATLQSETAPPAPPPSEPAAGADLVGFAQLSAGDCFDPVEDPAAADLAVWRVDCDVPHRFEAFDVLPYEGETAAGAHPGGDVVREWAEQACYDRFEAFVGVRWTLSELDLQTWWPSPESWARGDDDVICAVRADSRELLSGSQRGTGR